LEALSLAQWLCYLFILAFNAINFLLDNVLLVFHKFSFVVCHLLQNIKKYFVICPLTHAWVRSLVSNIKIILSYPGIFVIHFQFISLLSESILLLFQYFYFWRIVLLKVSQNSVIIHTYSKVIWEDGNGDRAADLMSSWPRGPAEKLETHLAEAKLQGEPKTRYLNT
jgi:hypothetical protein